MDNDAANTLVQHQIPALHRFLRFALVGGSGVVVNFAVVWICESLIFNGLPLLQLPLIGSFEATAFFSLLAGIVVSILSNFIINDAWTWADRSKTTPWLSRCRDFYITNGLAAGLQFAVAWALFKTGVFEISVVGLNIAPWSTRLASLAAIIIATPLNFVVNNVWTFRER
jgi:dolichol-phosphate mannosyltransferase